MEEYQSWSVEQVWGSDRFYHEGDVAEDQYAFVIDSGISLNTGDLNVNQEWSKSFTSDPDPFNDQTGHGTAVASVIGAKANYEGLTGVAPGAQVVALKVFDTGMTFRSRIENALQHAKQVIIENDLVDRAVVNLSLGGTMPDNHPTVEELAELGVKVVVAAGNERSDVDGFSPASYGHLENVYTVSANDKYGYYSHFTNFDTDDGEDDVDFTAPGTAIPTYNTDGTIRNRNGTSFSAPHVAGLLLMSDIKAGQTFELTDHQEQRGMIPDPLAMFDSKTYKHTPEPVIVEVPVYVEVPVPEPYPVYVEVPVPEPYPVPVDPIIGDWDKSNRITGTTDDDAIYGGMLSDIIKGGKGNDTIVGFGGDDSLRGGQGDDLIFGGQGGKTKMRGGMGADTFFLNGGEGYSVIKDFDASEDRFIIPFEYDLTYGDGWTKMWVEDDLIAKFIGHHSQLV